ncbi:hypothetical protein CORAM0001_1565 [Corynebacterium amycolatum SK46]|nr:hypothetical protein CORAM0001_1565 [Corynebacterium amycolatum SK46]
MKVYSWGNLLLSESVGGGPKKLVVAFSGRTLKSISSGCGS